MNLIVIMMDSLRQDHVGAYNRGVPLYEGIRACETPNMDKLARESIVFDNVYPEALPTIPVRTALMTGQRTLPNRPWQPLHESDVTMAEILSAEGYVCGLVSDTYHYRAPGMNFHRGFQSYHWIRGQEYDPYVSSPVERSLDDYVNEAFPERWRALVGQFLANTDGFKKADDWFAPQVFRTAADWLRRNRNYEKIFLWIDSFDPHEPWDPPEQFDTYTDPNYSGARLVMPMGGPAESWASANEVDHVRGLYAGEVAAVDHALGELLEVLEELGYYEDSMILLIADHGHPLADHGKFLKGPDRMYNELLKVPCMLRMPDLKGAGAHNEAVAQFHDLLPTVFDYMGFTNVVHDMHGYTLRGVIEGDSDTARESVIVGYYEGLDRCIRDSKWSLVARPEGEQDELYDLKADPTERNNLILEHPEEAERLRSEFGSIYFGRGGSVRSGRHAHDFKGVQGKYEVASGVVG
ncbi:MAG: sulfatase [Chloroflexi bacterium]|nr:sulfatase [Chloroflexota bacterium]MCY3937954.1 sulfatase [Chloroflexota bacterium]